MHTHTVIDSIGLGFQLYFEHVVLPVWKTTVIHVKFAWEKILEAKMLVPTQTQ